MAHRTLAAALACWLWVGPAFAQGQPRTSPQDVPPPRIRGDVLSLMQSPDPRLQAWGAWIAGRDHVRTAQPLLEQMAATAIESEPDAPIADFVLDALIELRARLTPDLLARIAERRTTEGLILVANVDDGTVDGVLLSMLDRRVDTAWLATANLLMGRRPPGFVAHLLAGLRLRASIVISESGRSGWGEGGSGFACGLYGSTPGMPPWPSYHLSTTPAPGDRVLALGPTPVYYDRRVSAAGEPPYRGGTFSERASGAGRLRYVEAVFGRRLGLADGEQRSVRRRPHLDVAALSEGFREDLTRRHVDLLRDLVGSGLLTREEAATLTLEVDITIHDVP